MISLRLNGPVKNKGNRLLFFFAPRPATGTKRAPSPNLEAISALPIQFSERSLPIQTFTNCSSKRATVLTLKDGEMIQG